ncbi:MAG: LysM peptidoglycan-binding domain-containing protein, partial [Deltaproteobacteria bacterium]|nr:LysM peptidoglycan-binding domain-containing protein [Deltaproteobacteria bacterium]
MKLPFICSCIIAVYLLVLSPVSALGKKPYKIYIVNKYGAWDIVCDRYTVKKDDHIWEILRRKGRLSEEDFPKFVKILKDMNPNIKDVDKIYPGQNIVIPLKEMPARGTGVKEGPRYVTIPMIPDVLFDYYKVKPGDYVSKIVTARLGVSWNEIPSDYFKTFKRLNPDMENIDLIYPGQTVRIPELSTYKQSTTRPGSTPPEKELLAQAIPTPTGEIDGIAQPGASAPSPVEAVPAVEEVTLPKPEGLSAPKPENAALVEGSPGKTIEDEVEGASYTQPKAISSADIVLSEAKISKVATAPPPIIAKEERLPVQSETQEEIFTKIARPKLPVQLSVKGRTTREKIAKLGSKKLRSPQRPRWQGFVSKVAAELGGRLLSSGYCYFPRKEKKDVPLDLGRFPVIELKSGRHVLLETETALPRGLEEAVRNSWKDMAVIRVDRDAEKLAVLDKVFRGLFGSAVKKHILIPPLDDGVQVALRGDWVFSQQENKDNRPTYYSVTAIETSEEYTPVSAVKYLTKKGIRIIDILIKKDGKDRGRPVRDEDSKTAVMFVDGSGPEAFISGLVGAMGYYYEPQVPIFFDYAGFQV